MANRKTSSSQETDEMSVAWNKLPWRKLEQHCFRIQKRIYQAKQNGNTRKVEKLQKLLMKSERSYTLLVMLIITIERPSPAKEYRLEDSKEVERVVKNGIFMPSSSQRRSSGSFSPF